MKSRFKNIDSEVADVDNRTVVVYVSKFGNIDLDGDMLLPGAYKKSITERGKKGTNELFHLSNHRVQPEYILSKPDFEEDTYGLKMISTIANTTHGNDIIEHYKNGNINQHSVMFSVPSGMWRSIESDGKSYTEIMQAKLYEGSTVLWGANPETPTLEIKSFLKSTFKDSITDAFKELTKLTKAFKNGKYSDEFFPILEIQIKHLETYIQETIEDIKSKQPESISVVPPIQEVNQNESIINLLKKLNQEL
jgi:HK97 family phage prohead protease